MESIRLFKNSVKQGMSESTLAAKSHADPPATWMMVATSSAEEINSPPALLRFFMFLAHFHSPYLILFLFSIATTYSGLDTMSNSPLFPPIVDLANWRTMADSVHSFGT